MAFNSKIWSFKKSRGMSLRDPLSEATLPEPIEDLSEDLKEAHRIGRIVGREEAAGEGDLEDLGDGVYVRP